MGHIRPGVGGWGRGVGALGSRPLVYWSNTTFMSGLIDQVLVEQNRPGVWGLGFGVGVPLSTRKTLYCCQAIWYEIYMYIGGAGYGTLYCRQAFYYRIKSVHADRNQSSGLFLAFCLNYRSHRNPGGKPVSNSKQGLCVIPRSTPDRETDDWDIAPQPRATGDG